MQDWFNIQKSENVIQHIWKTKTGMINSIVIVKVYDKNPKSFPDKYSQQSRNRREPQPDEGQQQKSWADVRLKGETLERTPPLTTSISHPAKVLASAISQEKEICGFHIRKEDTELSLFIDDNIIHWGNLMESTKKVLDLSNKGVYQIEN